MSGFRKSGHICDHTKSWLIVDVVFKMHHNATSSFLVKSTSSSNANVAAGTCNNLKNVTENIRHIKCILL